MSITIETIKQKVHSAKELTFKKANKAKIWIIDHKKQIIAVCFSIAGTVAVYELRKSTDTLAPESKEQESEANTDYYAETNTELFNNTSDDTSITIPDDFYNSLTGNRLTAKELGNILFYTPQKINKRIVDAGLAYKNALGEYELTELGKGLGEKTYKETSYGWPFTNIEWDEAILTIIFSPEELAERKAFVANLKCRK